MSTDEQALREASDDEERPRRALMLAGGGLKVAFQAGVLQVWLDEMDVEFDHFDGASGGVFNLAMLCQGYSGAEIADAWRRFKPLDAAAPSWSLLWRTPFFAPSLLSYSRFKKNIFRDWGLDFRKIRATDLSARFNVYNFSRHRLEALPASAMTQDMLVACVSLPGWFPAVKAGGETYIDSVYLSDSNIEDAIARGADELWIVWTVSDRSEWHSGPMAQYFQVIETAAVGRLHAVLERIEANNQAIAEGRPGEFGRTIRVHMLKDEVQLNYLLNLNQDRFAETVNRGVEVARSWAREQGLPLREPTARTADAPRAAATKLRFSEQMRGWVATGARTPVEGRARGRELGTALTVSVTINVEDLETFVRSPAHEAPLSGFVDFAPLGGRLEVESGTFNLLVAERDELHKRMRYRLFLRGADRSPYTLVGEKRIEVGHGLHVWRDTTTLFTRLYEGHCQQGEETGSAALAAGVIHITVPAFARQLASFRVEAPDRRAQAGGMLRFGRLFAGKLWDIYARPVMPWSPF